MKTFILCLAAFVGGLLGGIVNHYIKKKKAHKPVTPTDSAYHDRQGVKTPTN